MTTTRCEYAHDGWMVDIDIRRRGDELEITFHKSRSDRPVSPAVGELLDVTTLDAIEGIVIVGEADTCEEIRRLLGAPPGYRRVVPSLAATPDTPDAGVSSRTDEKIGGRIESCPCSEQGRWLIHPTEGVILYLGGLAYAHSMAELQALKHGHYDIRVYCSSETTDEQRHAIIEAGWHLDYPTRREHLEADGSRERAIIERLHAEREARSGGQRNDQTPASSITPTVTRGDVLAMIGDRERVAVRVKTPGYGAISDIDGLPGIEELLPSPKAKARILYAADALGEGFVGSFTGGQIQEICYEIDGARWYLYLLNTSGGDTWHQEWWTSHQRLTAQAAGDAIEAARKMVLP